MDPTIGSGFSPEIELYIHSLTVFPIVIVVSDPRGSCALDPNAVVASQIFPIHVGHAVNVKPSYES
ncbi:hypothetical protein BpHYR1_048521 [Brachionus plicatilis]|uniref:Uncharacterized protein n=1 Tax=Brachionus plicatilis TaxID=10195 RepID=A0A3M7Q6G4_BRAPC|nr:hypothetical protein BpHYR1_048521 [Brachionus plicatilis]